MRVGDVEHDLHQQFAFDPLDAVVQDLFRVAGLNRHALLRDHGAGVDTLVDDEMRFDYCLKTGPVTRSNAIAIMRAVGLDLPNDD